MLPTGSRRVSVDLSRQAAETLPPPLSKKQRRDDVDAETYGDIRRFRSRLARSSSSGSLATGTSASAAVMVARSSRDTAATAEPVWKVLAESRSARKTHIAPSEVPSLPPTSSSALTVSTRAAGAGDSCATLEAVRLLLDARFRHLSEQQRAFAILAWNQTPHGT